MRAYVGVTDSGWYRQLRERGATEVNFWQPSAGHPFKAISQGAPFLFKTHYRGTPSHRIVGIGFFSGWARLPVSQAWDFFGLNNGCQSLEEMRSRIAHYRRGPITELDPQIGCIMLRDVSFLEPEDSLPPPADWASNIVSGKSYEVMSEVTSPVEQVLLHLLAMTSPLLGELPGSVDGPVFGDPRLVPVRLGQGAFKAMVQEAYGRRCAVTGDKIVPVLQAAHIRPVTSAGAPGR